MILGIFLYGCALVAALGIAFLIVGLMLEKSNFFGHEKESCPSMKKFRCDNAEKSIDSVIKSLSK
ncbi:MAG: hypothetical protein IKX04_11260 [Clostridiales bacterium]|nr:hypothetical protein [Clostridiales bacterium]MBR4818437.1 hypothetical protein [Clostridiales bacterium]MBR5059122.1 hypothetical protein [Clostridiales bacterium]